MSPADPPAAGGSEAAAVSAALAAKAQELESELRGLSESVGDPGGISFGKRVGDGTSVAVERLSQVAAHDRLQVMLADVRRARSKLVEGSYGTCDSCGAAIHADRLEALPWATHCIDCAALR
jgi:DnaK suppressor protein